MKLLKLKLIYETISESGQCHNKIFEIKCSLINEKSNATIESATATGTSLHRAKNSAADLLLKQTKLEKQDPSNLKKNSNQFFFLVNDNVIDKFS